MVENCSLLFLSQYPLEQISICFDESDLDFIKIQTVSYITVLIYDIHLNGIGHRNIPGSYTLNEWQLVGLIVDDVCPMSFSNNVLSITLKQSTYNKKNIKKSVDKLWISAEEDNNSAKWWFQFVTIENLGC